MANQVNRRIYDYLKNIPPFTLLNDEAAFMRIALPVEVTYPGPVAVLSRDHGRR